MGKYDFDIIVIGAGSGGLSVGLFMNQAGFKVMMVSRSEEEIGGDCLNDGCVPSKALIHAARLVSYGRQAGQFGLKVEGKADIKKVISYIRSKQLLIRKHENAQWLRDQGIFVALGNAAFVGDRMIDISGTKYSARKIVIATGSSPRKLVVDGVDQVDYYDNERIFQLEALPEKILCVGGGPIGLEMAQALSRLGSKVTMLHQGASVLEHDDQTVTTILMEQLAKEEIRFVLEAELECFTSATKAVVKTNKGTRETVEFDAVFVAIGRELLLEPLALSKAGIEVVRNKIRTDQYLRTSNRNVMVCGDVAGDLQFSHAAEFHARIILNNLFSPFKQKLNNQYMSWVTFTDPELATFGFNEKQLVNKQIKYRRLEKGLTDDDRAVVDDHQYGKLILFVSKAGFLRKQRLLGGTMIAPNAGELIQELILANTAKLSVKAIFNKIYPYPVASRINQALVTDLMSEGLTPTIKSLLKKAYQFFS